MIFSLIAPLFALILFKLCNWIIRKTKNRDFIVYISGASLNSEEKKIDKSLDAFLAVCIIAICSYLPITIGINLHDFSISNNSRNAINISVNYADQKSKNKIIRIEPNRIERFYFDYKFDSKMKKSTDLEINIYNIELSDKLGNNRDMVKIEKIIENKKQFLDLLLLADEQENMIDKYLPSGDLFALYDDDLKSVCVVVPINSETCELKNIATYEKYQGKGYGRALINFIFDFYKNDYKTMLVGTGETPTILSFYESCGFEKSHRVKNFFTDNYDHPMFEGDIQLVDMIYLKKDL
jgi:GNAT superfamily N-acetyltransferase